MFFFFSIPPLAERKVGPEKVADNREPRYHILKGFVVELFIPCMMTFEGSNPENENILGGGYSP